MIKGAQICGTWRRADKTAFFLHLREQPGFFPEKAINADDVAEACLLALKTSSKCVPSEITLRNSQNCAFQLYDPTELMMEKLAGVQK